MLRVDQVVRVAAIVVTHILVAKCLKCRKQHTRGNPWLTRGDHWLFTGVFQLPLSLQNLLHIFEGLEWFVLFEHHSERYRYRASNVAAVIRRSMPRIQNWSLVPLKLIVFENKLLVSCEVVTLIWRWQLSTDWTTWFGLDRSAFFDPRAHRTVHDLYFQPKNSENPVWTTRT